jgi:hypothetical protein
MVGVCVGGAVCGVRVDFLLWKWCGMGWRDSEMWSAGVWREEHGGGVFVIGGMIEI